MSFRGLFVASLILNCLLAMPLHAAGSVNPKPSASLGVNAPSRATTYKTVSIKGLNIFYREAGPSNGPAILLLHGFPSSSRMFDTLMPLLADRYHLLAPDYPGFGNSDAPSPKKFSYTFDAIANVIDDFTQAVHLDRYALYLQITAGRSVTSLPSRTRGG
jgi:hypothetical protein